MATATSELEREHEDLAREVAWLADRIRRIGYAPALTLGRTATVEEARRVRRHLEEHLEFEDRVLYPMIEIPAAERAPLQKEHAVLRALAQELEGGAGVECAMRLFDTLHDHMVHEDRVIHAATGAVPAERLEALHRRMARWHLEYWAERASGWLSLAGIRLEVRDVHDGVADLIVRSPLSDPDSRRDLEERLLRRILTEVQSVVHVEFHYEDPGR